MAVLTPLRTAQLARTFHRVPRRTSAERSQEKPTQDGGVLEELRSLPRPLHRVLDLPKPVPGHSRGDHARREGERGEPGKNAGRRLMPGRGRSRYAFRRRLRLLRESRRRSRARRAFIVVAAVLVLALPLLAIPAFAAESVTDLPAVDGLSSSALHQDMLIFDRHGNLIDDIGDHGDHRIVVPLKSMSPYIRQATIAIEDKTFYKNSGIDFGGIARAAIADYTHHHIAQGGSTISQQLVKQVFIGPNPPPTIQRSEERRVGKAR